MFYCWLVDIFTIPPATTSPHPPLIVLLVLSFDCYPHCCFHFRFCYGLNAQIKFYMAHLWQLQGMQSAESGGKTTRCLIQILVYS